ncbi:MAG: tautomerase family protein [Lachnospiraceae bacterium]|nr:tautomerase family protein [Lachnospiraceae bacterium]
MPLVRIEMIKGKSGEYKTTVLDVVHNCLVDAFGIEGWDRFQRIIEIDKEDFELPEGKTEDFLIIELTIFPGRTGEQKKHAIELITETLNKRLSIRKTDVFIVINEPPGENWGLAGKQME